MPKNKFGHRKAIRLTHNEHDETKPSSKEEIGLWKQALKNKMLLMIVCSILALGLVLIAIQVHRGKLISAEKLFELIGLFLVLAGTLWAGLGVYLAGKDYEDVMLLVHATKPQAKHINIIGGLFVNASICCMQGFVVVLIGAVIGLFAGSLRVNL